MIEDFNPRTREGCDQIIYELTYNPIIISINAPVKDATKPAKPIPESHYILIHAPVKDATTYFNYNLCHIW